MSGDDFVLADHVFTETPDHEPYGAPSPSGAASNRGRAAEVSDALEQSWLSAHDLGVIEQAIAAAEARGRAEGAAEALEAAATVCEYTPLSERESGELSDFTKGWHAAAAYLRDRAAALRREGGQG